jgi:hypothetical protein
LYTVEDSRFFRRLRWKSFESSQVIDNSKALE